MDFNRVIARRHSSRSFLNKKVNFDKLIEAIDTANKGPFAGNHNNFQFVIVEDKKTIKEISRQANQTWVEEAPSLIVVCSDETHLRNLYGEMGKCYSRQQAGAVINTIILKLTEQGVNSCWVGSMGFEMIKQILKIPSQIRIEAIIPVGYEKGRHKKERKKDIENALKWENWDTDKRPTYFKEAPMDKKVKEKF